MSAERAEEILSAVGLVYRHAGWNALNPAAKTMLAGLITAALASSQAEVARLNAKWLRASERADTAEQRAGALEAALRRMLDTYTGQQTTGSQNIEAKRAAVDAARELLPRAAPRPEGA